MSHLPANLRTRSAAEVKQRNDLTDAGVPFLLLRDDTEAQRVFPLESSASTLLIGRQDELDVPLLWDHSVSRAHARVERIGVQCKLQDEGSSYGTFVNGKPLTRARQLNDGDLIRVGQTTIAFISPRYSVTAPPPKPEKTKIPRITPKQHKALTELVRPMLEGTSPIPPSNQEIADAMEIQTFTVKDHLAEVYIAYEITETEQNRKRLELAQKAIELGAVTDEDLARSE